MNQCNREQGTPHYVTAGIAELGCAAATVIPALARRTIAAEQLLREIAAANGPPFDITFAPRLAAVAEKAKKYVRRLDQKKESLPLLEPLPEPVPADVAARMEED